jgi:PTH1 family peptidyl-tRNA hydrolase
MLRLIVGLGNPGKKYEETRHNVGFMVIDRLSKVLKAKKYEECCFSHLYKVKLKGENLYLAKPMTFMNLSGIAVKNLITDLNILPEEMLVIHDDLDLPLGTTKLKFGGSSAGHKGLESIIKEINTKNFYRLRIGIGRPKEKKQVVNYVLSPFTSEQWPIIEESLNKAVECILKFLLENKEKAFNFCNS